MHPLAEPTIVHVAGMLEPSSFPGLMQTLTPLLNEPPPRIILECSQLTYVGTAELKELQDLAHIARALHGDIKCVHLAPTIEQIVNLSANGDPLECYGEVDDALAAFQGRNVTSSAHS